jgi:alpha-methylacyl-CoA racemase
VDPNGRSAGPLAGVRVIELAGIGPGPFCGMILADLGADVVRIDRLEEVGASRDPALDALARGRRSVAVDLKHPQGAEAVLLLAERADVLIEGYRPGVAERLGIGPAACLERNAALVYGRMTGWGQDGPQAPMAGHDINYIALTGVLAAIGRAGDRPVVPLNLIGDFGGGGMLLAVGVLAALMAVRAGGLGQVVDAAMTDGSALLMCLMHGMRASGQWEAGRERNLLDGGRPYYDVYATADGRHVAVGALEDKFYVELLDRLGLKDIDPGARADPATWPALRGSLTEAFAARTRDEWAVIFAGSDACVTPVLDLDEAPDHPHNVARATYVGVGGATQPAPAPRFSATPLATPAPPPLVGADTGAALSGWGVPAERVEALRAAGAIHSADQPVGC